MKPYERVKYLRKDILGLTQNEFANKLKMSRSNVCNIEKNTVALTDRVINDISNTFKISEEWIRSGLEPMQRNDFQDNNSMMKIAEILSGEDDDVKEIINLILNFTPEEWRAIKTIIEKIKSL